MFVKMDKAKKSICLKFLFACYFFYLISIVLKMVYSAEIVEIIAAFPGATKASVGTGLTAYYFVYTAAQLIVAFIINKINIKAFMTVTTVLSALSFGAIYFSGELWQLYIILGLNGVFQSGVWGGVMYFVGKYVPREMAAFSSSLMSTGMALGTALAYGLSAFFVAVADWRWTFVFFAAISLVTLVIFLVFLKKIDAKSGAAHPEIDLPKEPEEKKLPVIPHGVHGSGMNAALIMLIVIAFFAGCVYYSISNWVPSLLTEEYGMLSQYSMLLTIALPVCMMPGPIAASALCDRHDNKYGVCAIFSAGAFIAVFVMCFLYNASLWLALVLSIAMLFCIRGVIQVICGYFPLVLKDRINSGVSSLMFNAGACLGAAIMPLLTGLIMDAYGWRQYYIFTAAIALVTAVLIIIAALHDRKKKGTFFK